MMECQWILGYNVGETGAGCDILHLKYLNLLFVPLCHWIKGLFWWVTSWEYSAEITLLENLIEIFENDEFDKKRACNLQPHT